MTKRLDNTILDLLESTARNIKAHPVNLGGVSGTGGGEGAPPGGYIGWLPQTRVAYDTDELAYSGILSAPSGTLVDNLAHIRNRLQLLEAGTLIVDDWDGSPSITGVNRITFSGAIITDLGGGHVQIVTGSGGGGDPTLFVPYIGATSDVDLGTKKITASGLASFHKTRIREGEYLQIGADVFAFPDDPDLTGATTSYISIGEGGYVAIGESPDDSLVIYVDGYGYGRVLQVGYNSGATDIEAKLGDIDGDFHGYFLNIYSGGAEFNSNVNIPSGYTYNINGIPHTHSGGGYTDEQAQDAIGAMIDSTLTYVDATPSLGISQTILDGWIPGIGTWSYSSADSPTFVISVNANVTSLIGVGDRIKLTQTTNKYFIVTAMGSYSGGATLITVYGGTDYTLANAAISSPYYSHIKNPFGFPPAKDKWSVKVTDGTLRSQTNPTQNTWYNLGSISISVPIGGWNLDYQVSAFASNPSTSEAVYITLSTGNNTETDLEFSTYAAITVAGATTVTPHSAAHRSKFVSVASKTSYYLNARTTSVGSTIIGFNNGVSKETITAECAYL